MKRFVSLDFLRGVAIIGVLAFHMLNVLYNYEAAIASNPPWPYYSLVIFLVYVGQFDILFVILSGVVNTISIDNQWKKAINQDSTVDQKRLTAKKILKTQLIRGLFILAMAYISEVLLNGFLLNLIIQQPEPFIESLGGLFYSNILHAIALGVIISGVLYTQLLSKGKGQEWISKRLFLVTMLILALTPFMLMLSRTFPYFYTGWQSRSVGWNVLYFFISPVFRSVNPLFPFAAFGVIGALIGSRISSGKIEKALANRWVIASVLAFVVGLGLYFLKIADFQAMLKVASGTLPYYFLDSVYYVGENLMVMGGALLAMLVLLYTVDVRGKVRGFAKYTVSIRRFGLVSLTVWSLQWAIVPIFMGYHSILNVVTGKSTAFLEGNFTAGAFGFKNAPGLTSWEFLFWTTITLAIWSLFLQLWGKTDFKGSFEWLTVKLMKVGRKDAGQRLNMSASLYNVESAVEKPQNYWGLKTRLALTVLFLVMATLYVLVTLLI